MSNNAYMGMGHNPDPNMPDMPLGLGMRLFQETQARENYEAMPDNQKIKVIEYVQKATTGDDARSRISTAVKELGDNDLKRFL